MVRKAKKGEARMPYRHAHHYLLLLMALTVLAFWPSYFSTLGTASAAAHIHGFTASLWIALLATQSWTIHHGQNAVHRTIGAASLAIFPFFLASNLLIVQSMSWRFATADNPFSAAHGARLALLDLVATGAVALLYWSALRWRRKVHLHSRYLLATVFFLFAPIFARIFGLYVPGLKLAPPQFANLPLNAALATAGTLLLALVLARKAPRHGRPWLITAAFLAVQLVMFVTVGVSGPWENVVRAIGALSPPLVFAIGLAAGTLLSWLGWGAVPPRAARAAAAA